MGMNGSLKWRRRALHLAMVFPAMLPLPALALITTEAPIAVSANPAAASGDETARLCETIKTEIAAQPNAKSVEDIEALIVFRLSQTTQPWASQNPALSCVGASSDASAALRQAVLNVRTAFLHQRLTVGTGAITGGSAGIFGRSSFIGPILYVGGGTSNYSA